jgi:hypothetical protein
LSLQKKEMREMQSTIGDNIVTELFALDRLDTLILDRGFQRNIETKVKNSLGRDYVDFETSSGDSKFQLMKKSLYESFKLPYSYEEVQQDYSEGSVEKVDNTSAISEIVETSNPLKSNIHRMLFVMV